MVNRITNAFTVAYGYPVVFTHDVFDPGNPVLSDLCREIGYGRGATPCLVLVDAGLAAAVPGLTDRIAAYGAAHADVVDLRRAPVCITGGEAAKEGWAVPDLTLRLATDAGLCRHSIILAVGGGAMLDAVGLGAALFHRGARLLRLPTTVLAQNDSGVGVKNGINLGGVKNLAGTFAPPAAVVNDLLALRTLSDRDWIAGCAEAFKVAAIADAGFLAWLDDHAEALRQRDQDAMETLVQRCAALHAAHIGGGGDAFEAGSARPLDFGHWAGHRLESMTGFGLRHGEAVAIGMALDLVYAWRHGLIDADDGRRVIAALRRCGLPIWHDQLERRAADGQPAVLAGLDDFQQHLGGVLHVTFPSPLGQRRELTAIDRRAMSAAIAELRDLQAAGSTEGRAPCN